MKCINCNQDINEGTPICYHCGAVQPVGQPIENGLPEVPAATPVENPSLQQAMPPLPPVQAAPPEIPATPATPAAAPPLAAPPVVPPTPNEPYFDDQPEKTFNVVPEKKGMSGLTKGLIIGGVVLLLAAIAGGLYYFLSANSVSRLQADSDEVTFTLKGGEKTVGVTTDAKEFEVVKSPEWTQVEVTSDNELIIKCDSLTSPYKDREDIIRIKAGDLQADITVKQNANASYIKVPSEYETFHDGVFCEIEFDIDGDGRRFDYTIDYEGYEKDWMELAEKSSSSVTFETYPNYSYDARYATVTITSGKCKDTIRIKQVGKCLSCNGTGRRVCDYCNGYATDYDYDLGYMVDCPKCDGEAYITCSSCGGSGDGN